MWQGAEQEFALNTNPLGLFRALNGKNVFVFRPEDNIPRAFLMNGGQCYIHSNLFEVCTPECRTPVEVLAYEKASEAYARLASWALEDETGERVHLYKTSIATDPKEEVKYSTVGSHENYQVERKTYEKNLNLLIPYLMLRPVFCGAGGYVDGPYMISPRAIFPKVLFSEVSTDWPIISTRDESHSEEQYSRAHIVHGEGARSEYTILLKHSITSYLLQAMTAGYIKNVPEIEDPISQGQLISRNLTGDWKVQLMNGDQIGVIDYLNSYYLEGIEELFEDREPLNHDLMVLNEFKRVLNKLEDGLFESLDDELEWVIKQRLIDKGLPETFSFDAELSEMEAKEAAVHQYMAVTDPLYDELVEAGKIKTLLGEEEIQRAFMKPPPESRGELRVAISRHFRERMKTISWSYMKLPSKIHYYPIEFNEMEGWTHERIDEKIKEIEAFYEN
jgi:proteasome accessory factor A